MRKNRRLLFWAAVLSLGVGSWEEAAASGDPAQEGAAPVQEYRTVRQGDTLWGIAEAVLGEPRRWPEIWERNRGTIQNPNLIYPGQIVRLAPQPSSEQPAETAPAPKEEAPPEAAGPLSESAPEPDAPREPAEARPEPVPHSPKPMQILKSQAMEEGLGKILAVRKKGEGSGKIEGSASESWLLGPGDSVQVSFRKKTSLAAGTRLIVYRPEEVLTDPDGENADEDDAVRYRQIGVLTLPEPVEGRSGWAEIVDASDSIEVGDRVQTGGNR